MESSADFDAFLSELYELADRTIAPLAAADADGDASSASATATQCLALLPELERIGWDRCEVLDGSLRAFSISCRDTSGRDHRLRINVPTAYPHAPVRSLAAPDGRPIRPLAHDARSFSARRTCRAVMAPPAGFRGSRAI